MRKGKRKIIIKERLSNKKVLIDYDFFFACDIYHTKNKLNITIDRVWMVCIRSSSASTKNYNNSNNNSNKNTRCTRVQRYTSTNKTWKDSTRQAIFGVSLDHDSTLWLLCMTNWKRHNFWTVNRVDAFNPICHVNHTNEKFTTSFSVTRSLAHYFALPKPLGRVEKRIVIDQGPTFQFRFYIPEDCESLALLFYLILNFKRFKVKVHKCVRPRKRKHRLFDYIDWFRNEIYRFV